MREGPIPGPIVDRLRANLRAADIRATDADIEGMSDKGFLRSVAAFEELVSRSRTDAAPDYLEQHWAHPARDLAADVTDAVGGADEATPTAAGDRQEGEHAGGGKARLRRSADAAGDAVAWVPLVASGSGEESIAALASLIRDGEVSPVELTESKLRRIEERDAHLNAFQLVLRAEALDAARRAEREIARGGYRGPLHGVPVAVKDLVAMRGTPTSAGSSILRDRMMDRDATVVERLRAAGAVIVGKTRLSEFAYSPGSNNAHFGPTRNPWDGTRDSGGSSSGSAAAVADGLVFAAVGTDTGGSIRIPASLCGVVGVKPTFGRTSLHGVFNLAWSLDHLGPIAGTVTDAALMLRALEGQDPRDPRTVASPPVDLPDGRVERVRIGVVGTNGVASGMGTPEAIAAWRDGLAALERAGAELVAVDLPQLSELWTLTGAILALEAAAYHEPMLRARLDDYGEFMRHRILSAYAYGPHSFVRAQQARAEYRERMKHLLRDVDLVSTPTMPYAAPPLGEPGTTMHTAPFNVLGWPAVSVPVGLTAAGLPLGLQLAGRRWHDSTVLRAAAAVDAADPGGLRSRHRAARGRGADPVADAGSARPPARDAIERPPRGPR